MADMWGDREEQQEMLPMSFVLAGGFAFLGGLVYGAYTFKQEHRLSGAAIVAVVEGLVLLALGHQLVKGRQFDMMIQEPTWDEDASTAANEGRGYVGAYLNREIINRFQKVILGAALGLFVLACWILEQICGSCV